MFKNAISINVKKKCDFTKPFCIALNNNIVSLYIFCQLAVSLVWGILIPHLNKFVDNRYYYMLQNYLLIIHGSRLFYTASNDGKFKL